MEQLSILSQDINENKLREIKQKKLLFVGRLVKEKGLDILIKVISQVVASNSNIVLFIVGGGKEMNNLIISF